MEVTLFVPTIDGLLSNDHTPDVYHGRLTKEQIELIAIFNGAVGKGGYARTKVEENDDGSFSVSYFREEAPDDLKDGEIEEPDGDLSYLVCFEKVLKAPSTQKASKQ